MPQQQFTSDEALRVLLQAMDTDHNGNVDFHEFYNFIKRFGAGNGVVHSTAPTEVLYPHIHA